jgi:hypothetical protein
MNTIMFAGLLIVLVGCTPDAPLSERCKKAGYVDPIALRKQISADTATYLCPYMDVAPELRNITNPDLCKDITHGMCDGFDCWNYQWSQCLRCADYNSSHQNPK